MVIVEDHDGAHHAAGHHDHDAGEVGSYQRGLTARGLHVRHHVHEHCQRHQDCDLQCHLLTRVWRKVETKNSHANMRILTLHTKKMVKN